MADFPSPRDPGDIAFWWLRTPGDERQLTDCLGHLAGADPGIARGLVNAILTVVAENEPHSAAAVNQLLNASSVSDALTCTCESGTGAQMVRARRRFRSEVRKQGRVDWVFEDARVSSRFKLGVEVKVDSNPEATQLSRYHDWLMGQPAVKKGLVLLTREMPDAGLLDREGRPLWLGAILWEQLFARLSVAPVEPDHPELAQQWPHLISVLADREDVGTAPPSWESIATAKRKELYRLLSRVAPAVQTALQAIPEKQTGLLRSEKVRILRRYRTLELWVPPSGAPAVNVEVDVFADRVELLTWVSVSRSRFRAHRDREVALARLCGKGRGRVQPPFGDLGDRLQRRTVIARSDASLTEFVRGAVTAEMATVARSCFLAASRPSR